MQPARKDLPVLQGPLPEQPTLDISRTRAELPMAVALQKMAVATGTSPVKVMRDFSSLAFGPGRLSFRDYTNLRLFDGTRYASIDKRTFVGARRNRDIAVAINYRHDWYGLLSNKIASTAYLSTFGLPTIPIVAIFSDKLGTGSPKILRSRGELCAFLRDEQVYPLFGKPVEGFQSLGSAALSGYASIDDSVEKIDGQRTNVEAFADDVVSYYGSGYLFQPLMSPHRDVLALCGPRLATCRMLTLNTAEGPRLYRAVWKIPARGNAADNYWRAGNILARINVASGRVEAAMTGAGFDLVEITHHPDTGTLLIGAAVPNWDAMKATAVEGARLMRHVPMIGWDISSGPDGPVIVEMNQTPDFFLNQLADARGMLEPDFLAFMALQKHNAATHLRTLRSDLAKL